MKKLLTTIILGSFLTTSLFSQNFDHEERVFNDSERFYKVVNFEDDLGPKNEKCNTGSYTIMQYRKMNSSAFEENQTVRGEGSLRKSFLFTDGSGGTELNLSWKDIYNNMMNFNCSNLNETERVQKLALALFFRIPVGDWKNPEVRKLSELEKNMLRKAWFLGNLSNVSIQLDNISLRNWILNVYEKYEGEKIKDSDEIVRAIIFGKYDEANKILDNSIFLNNALKFMEEGDYFR